MENKIRELRKARSLTQADLAARLDITIAQVSKWESGKVDIPASRLLTLKEILGVNVGEILGVEAGTFDIVDDFDRLLPNGFPVAMEGAREERMREDLPIYGTALGAVREVEGEAVEQTTLNRAEVIHYVRRPTILDGNAAAYGLYVTGSSMEPRFRDGEMVLVDPKGRVRAGEDVILYLRPRNEQEDDGARARGVLIKTLVRQASQYIDLEQYSPAKVFRVPIEEVVRMDRVIPLNELLG